MFDPVKPSTMITDSDIIQNLIVNWDFINRDYKDHFGNQSKSKEVLLSYSKRKWFLLHVKRIMKLLDVFYASDLGFNLIGIIWLRK